MGQPYKIMQPTMPVPLSRVAIVVREAANRYWSMFTRYYGDDQWKWFDVDVALTDGADLLDRINMLAELTSDRYVRELIERAIEKHAPAERPVEASS